MTTLDELRTALTSSLATGKLGTPVALRAHAVVAEESIDPAAALDRLVNLAESVFGDPPQRLSARSSSDEQQWNVLINFPGGQTLLLSIVSIPPGPSNHGGLHFTLIGNHGIVRLEGAECFDDCWSGSGTVRDWQSLIEESRQRGAAVTVAPGS